MESIAALPALALRVLKTQIRRSFKAPVTETTWNFQRRRKQALNTKTNLLERQCSRADFQQANQRLKQKIQAAQGTKARFSQPQETKSEIRKPSQKHVDINPKHSSLGTLALVGN
ncbi:hypothetical protein R6H74_004655 [Vibrio parahaemolyticus]|nr:hypothetical protein [Vibrio parahaemolyticus]HAV1364105.1 hypothetical protein [Vibrio parahaemolyticus]HAV1471836.1 hypothetical protein [Vibrio parahaemolyticus]